MIGRRHLSERRLFEYCVAARAGDPLDPPATEHLADCSQCHQRYADLTTFLDDLRRDADAETDEVFGPDSQLVQQQQIAKRLAQIAQGARVITFPGREQRRPATIASRVASPWVAGAAAAGLFVGIGVGVFFDGRTVPPTTVVSPVTAPPAVASPAEAPVTKAAATPLLAESWADDDTFLSELERALEQLRTPELAALDALTPHVREVAFRTR
jgi:hypothetical protein